MRERVEGVRFVAIIGAAILAASSSGAGGAAPAAAVAANAPDLRDSPAFAAETEVVTIDCVVRDAAGLPVAGLTRDDFVVLDDGKPQALTMFEAVEARAPARPDSEGRTAGPANVAPGAPAEAGAPATGPAPASSFGDGEQRMAADRVTTVVLMDELHLSSLAAEQARRRLEPLLTGGVLGRTDLFIISSRTSGGYRLRLPEQADEVAAALGRYRGTRSPALDGRMNDREVFLIASRRDDQTLIEVYRRYMDLRLLPDIYFAEGKNKATGAETAIFRAAVLAEAESTWTELRRRQTTALQRITGVLSGLATRPGRKVVFLVSEGFVHDPAIELRDVVDAGRRAHASVHFVDVRPATSLIASHDVEERDSIDSRDLSAALDHANETADGARSLAIQTGGRALTPSTKLGEQLSRIAAELRTYYLLGYAPGAAADGRYHKLSVKLRREGYRVEARPGYYARSGAGSSVDVASAIEGLLDSPANGTGLPLQFASFVLGGARKGRSRVLLVGEVDVSALRATREAALDAVFQLVPRAAGDVQHRAVEAKLSNDGSATLRLEAEFQAPAGAYQGQLVVRSRSRGLAASRRAAVDVLPEEAFRMSTPIVTDEVLGTWPKVAPLARVSRRLPRTRTLYCFTEVEGAARSASVVAGLDVLDATRRVVRRFPTSPLKGPRLSRMWSLPLADLDVGGYELVVSVQDTAARQGLQRREPFEVVP